ncbi:FadR/GntR family transcriptional regulator [Nakamurella deserti]|uniref:FadR/GntR family transcriptional regulator n=1 Tax=Nakamurella deserti TaxID=2164074 RepID=UPI000DBE28BE|nr:FCD domain-containing protein [Nakamurella deserti]
MTPPPTGRATEAAATAPPVDVAPYAQLHDTVIETLGSEIVTGVLPAGSVVGADELAARLGVSRTVVREATRVLESVNLIRVRRKVGITVLPADAWSPYDPNVIRWRLAGPDRYEHLNALSELRSAVEPLAARLAARQATPEQCGALTAAVIGMSATARAANSEDYLRHDADFHRTLLAASGNPMLHGLRDVVVAVLEGRTAHALMPRVAEPEAVRLHGVVAASIQAGDPEAAETAMLAIVRESSTAVETVRAMETLTNAAQVIGEMARENLSR